MKPQRNRKRFFALLTALALAVGLCGCAAPAQKAGQNTPAAAGTGLFDTSVVHEIFVEISEADWADLLANPLEKTKYAVRVTIDGQTLENVSFATKGNTTLSQVASSDSDRYSFKLNFGKFEKGQTYHGLDKLNLNNIMSDATYMKDYLSYLIMREAGVSAPLTSYVRLYINGQLHGLYLAIEDVADEFLTRNYGSADGALYKPEAEDLDNAGRMERPDGESGQMPGGMQPPDGENGQMPGGMQPPDGENGQMPGGMQPPDGENGQMPGGFGSGNSGGADLVYAGQELADYPAIFDNEETDVTDADRQELIAALKSLQDGTAGEHWDLQQVARYFAAHNFVLNFDSYTGSMLHNYFLYEENGTVTILPWDYNLAFGGFLGGTDATTAVNWPIDSPLFGTDEMQRPLWKAIADDEASLALYHEAFDALLTVFLESGRCTEEIARVAALIRPFVAQDPTAFYSVEEFDAATEALQSFCALRAQSVRRQLDGTLGATSETQQAAAMVDAGSLTLSVMGTQGGEKGGRDGRNGQMPGGGPSGFPGGQGAFPGGRQDGRPPEFPDGTEPPTESQSTEEP